MRRDWAMGWESDRVLFRDAVDAYKRGQCVDALEMLDTLSRNYSGDPDIDYHRALCLAAIDCTEEAVRRCRTIVGQFEDDRVERLRLWIERRPEGAWEPPPIDPAAEGAMPHPLSLWARMVDTETDMDLVPTVRESLLVELARRLASRIVRVRHA